MARKNTAGRKPATALLGCTVGLGIALIAAGAWYDRTVAAAPSSEAVASARRELAAARERCLAAAKRTTVCRARLDEAQAQLDQLTRERLTELRRSTEGQVPDSSVVEPQPTPASEPSPQSAELERLQAKCNRLREQHAELLERFTPEHPAVQDVESQLRDAELKAESLAALQREQQLAQAPPPNSAEPSAQQRLRSQWQELLDGALASAAEVEAQRQQLEQELHAAETERSAAEQAYLDRADDLAALGSPGLAPATQRTAPASVGAWTTRLGYALIAATGCVWVVRLARQLRKKSEQLLRHAGQLERWFRVPVLPTLPGDDAQENERESRGRLATGISLATQLAIAVLIFVLVAMTVQDPSWLAAAATRPLKAFGDGLSRLW